MSSSLLKVGHDRVGVRLLRDKLLLRFGRDDVDAAHVSFVEGVAHLSGSSCCLVIMCAGEMWWCWRSASQIPVKLRSAGACDESIPALMCTDQLPILWDIKVTMLMFPIQNFGVADKNFSSIVPFRKFPREAELYWSWDVTTIVKCI